MDDKHEHEDIPAIDRRGEAAHLSYGVLRRYFYGEDLGGGWTADQVHAHLEECRVCEEKFHYIIGSHEAFQQRATDRWHEWRAVLEANRSLQASEDEAFRLHAQQAEDLQQRLDAAAAETDESKRAEVERKIFVEATNSCFLEASLLIGKEDVLGLAELSQKICQRADEQQREACGAGLAAACDFAFQQQPADLRDQSLNLLVTQAELSYPSAASTIPAELYLLAILKVFSLDWVHTRQNQKAVRFVAANGDRIVIRTEEYRSLLRTKKTSSARTAVRSSRLVPK